MIHLFQLLDEGGPLQIQHLCGFFFIAAALLQGFRDKPALESLNGGVETHTSAGEVEFFMGFDWSLLPHVFVRKILDRNDAAPLDYNEPLNQVFQLADIAGPLVVAEGAHRLWLQALYLLLLFTAE